MIYNPLANLQWVAGLSVIFFYQNVEIYDEIKCEAGKKINTLQCVLVVLHFSLNLLLK